VTPSADGVDVELKDGEDVKPEPKQDVKGKKKDSGGNWKEDPFHFLPADDPELASCV
jgi:hypothetical protein